MPGEAFDAATEGDSRFDFLQNRLFSFFLDRLLAAEGHSSGGIGGERAGVKANGK